MILELLGLDASNPLGLLAALGLLCVLDDDATHRETVRPRLRFVDQGALLAELTSEHSLESIIELVLRDAAAQSDNRALQFAYDEAGAFAPTGTRDLKPSKDGARSFLAQVANAPRRTASLAAAWFSELITDNNGNIKPTAFHFTAGQQAFLEMVEQLRTGVTASHLREALLGPWSNTSPLPSLSWDASVARSYALRATDPSGERRGSVPGANWLAVLGLACFPVVPRRKRLHTTAVAGGWKDSVFTWPVWSVPAELSAITSLLRSDVSHLTYAQRAARGVATVFSSRILRTDQGGYGSFSPAAVVLPGGKPRARRR